MVRLERLADMEPAGQPHAHVAASVEGAVDVETAAPVAAGDTVT